MWRSTELLAGGMSGARQVGELVTVALEAVAEASAERGGPAPGGGPAAVAADLAAALPDGLLPDHGVGSATALAELSRLLGAGSVEPAHPWCAAHLHCPPLAVAAVADLVASMVNPSMDSWDQAPAASEVERALTAELARLCFPGADQPDAVITSGGTESNLVGLLLARQAVASGTVHPVCGRNAHHSVARASWLLGLPAPRVADTDAGRMSPSSLSAVLAEVPGPAVVVATAGTTDTGAFDPLPAVALACRRAGAWLHVDAAYGGAALFSPRLAPLLDGLASADSVAIDLHKFGWQPIAAGVLATRSAAALTALNVQADYLNAADDTDAGLPDLLGRSIRTSRRPDAFKIAVTLRALGRAGMAALTDHCCRLATELAGVIRRRPGLRLWGEPSLSTVLFRPAVADELAAESGNAAADALVTAVRRRLLRDGSAVLGRAAIEPVEPSGSDPLVWLKLTLLHPEATAADYTGLLDLAEHHAAEELAAARATCRHEVLP